MRVVTANGDFRGKHVILSAGAWLPKLAGERYRDLKVQRQVQFWFKVSQPSLWRGCPIFIWTTGTRAEDLFYGFPMASPELRIKVASEQDRDPTGPDTVAPVSDDEKRQIYETHIAPRLNGVTAECVDAATCLYTNAPDYQFIIEPHPSIAGVTIVSACSGHGFKHSAGLGEAIAQWLTGERVLPLAGETRIADRGRLARTSCAALPRSVLSHLLLRHVPIGVGDQLHQVAVGVVEIDAAAAVVVVDFAGLRAARIGVVADALVADAGEGGVEFGVADQERVVHRPEIGAVGEIEGHAVLGADRHEMAPLRPGLEIEDVGQEFRRFPTVFCRD